MVQQDVALPNRREHARADSGRHSGNERRVAKIRTLDLREVPQPIEVEYVARVNDRFRLHRQRARKQVDDRPGSGAIVPSQLRIAGSGRITHWRSAVGM